GIWNAYRDPSHRISTKNFDGEKALVAFLSEEAKQIIEELRQETDHYKNLDDSVLFGIYAARQAVVNAGWDKQSNFGINIGSSRGATSLFEKYHQEFLKTGKSST
ncbi:beta-ketoacyl synthase, partial [Aquimarina celericrescens]|nr:beta-ketoacyl synthase [Aquimarina celericrescens]